MTDYISNTAFVEVLDPIPLEGIGWEVHAVSPLDWTSKVAVFPYWEEMQFTKPVSDPGYGRLLCSSSESRLQTDVAGYPLEDTEVLFQVYDEGVLRFDFLAQKAERPEDRPDTISLEGKGTATVLERAIVLPVGWPTAMVTTRTFTSTRIDAWLTLLNEAKVRDIIPQFTVTFDGAVDTAGMPWPTAETFDINVGDNLYDLLTQFCELYDATWVMRPGFHLDIYQVHGNDRQEEVIWHLGGHTQEHVYERDRSDIATDIYSGTDGLVVSASDLAAQTRWGKREAWVSAGDAKDAPALSRYANRNLDLLKDQKKIRTVTVPWKAPNRRVFVDWNPGDIAAVETLRDGVVAVKITAVTVKVDKDAQTSVEIVISDDPTAAMPYEVRVAQQQARNGARTTSTRASKANPNPAAAGSVVAGTGTTGGGSVSGEDATISIDVEWLQDQVAAMLLAGTDIDVTYDDGAGSITIDSLAAGGGGDLISWTKILNADPMSAGTNWQVRSGTWAFGGAFGVEQTDGGGDDYLECLASLASYEVRAIEAVIRPTSGDKVGFGFTSAGGGWGGGGLSICIDPNNDLLWYDRYGSGGTQISRAFSPGVDYTVKVVEVVAQSKFYVFVNGVQEWTVNRPGDINIGAVGLYTRSGQGWFRSVTVWGGTMSYGIPT